VKTLTWFDLQEVLRAVGVRRDQILFVHSDVSYLGAVEGGVDMIARSLRNACDCVVVPTFNFGFCVGQPFHRMETPSTLGVLSEHVRKLGRRSSHPTESIAAWGAGSSVITCADPAFAFDPSGAFFELYRMDAMVLVLGMPDWNITASHMAEAIAGVPYRSWKEFEGMVDDKPRRILRYVRTDPKQLTTDVPIAERLRLPYVKVNYGSVSLCRMRDWVDEAVSMIQKDPYALVVK
jgi:aminoglycoside N3'-acetyltransferase